MKKLLTLILFVAAMLVFTCTLKAQTMYFAEGVDNSGYPQGESSVFNIGSGGGWLYFLTRIPYDLNCKSVRYEIYRRDSYGTQKYYDTQYQNTERDWRWFYLKYTFYDSGNFDVYVYDCYDYLVTSGSVKIQFR